MVRKILQRERETDRQKDGETAKWIKSDTQKEEIQEDERREKRQKGKKYQK